MPTRQGFAAIVVAVLLQACMSWQAVPLEPRSFAPKRQDDLVTGGRRMRVTLISGLSWTVESPAISGDSLVWTARQYGARRVPERSGIPLKEIRQVAVLDVDAGRTVMGVAAVAGAALVLWAIVEPCGYYCPW